MKVKILECVFEPLSAHISKDFLAWREERPGHSIQVLRCELHTCVLHIKVEEGFVNIIRADVTLSAEWRNRYRCAFKMLR